MPPPNPPCVLGRELERTLEEALHRTDAEHERATAVQEELSRLREDMGKSEQEWKRSALYYSTGDSRSFCLGSRPCVWLNDFVEECTLRRKLAPLNSDVDMTWAGLLQERLEQLLDR